MDCFSFKIVNEVGSECVSLYNQILFNSMLRFHYISLLAVGCKVLIDVHVLSDLCLSADIHA